jgi:hypothetical protein
MMEAVPLWRVTAVDDTTIIVPNAGPLRAKRVSFVMSDGTPSYVELPTDQATDVKVASEIERMARQHFLLIRLQSDHVVQPGEGPQ